MPKVTSIYYAGYQPGASGFGWATCNEYLVRELSKLCEVGTYIPPEHRNGCYLEIPVFQPLIDHDFNPASAVRSVTSNVAYTFFESELGPNAAENAKLYDIVFCGSTWCLERMKEHGIRNGQVLVQGVDHEVFFPNAKPYADGLFRIFSGGKFEYRKGQDIVIAAFRELCKRHDNLRLVTAWHNPWPALIPYMFKSPHIKPVGGKYTDPDWFYDLLEANGIPEEKVEHKGPLSQFELAYVMNSTDLGVFPNRCEGGTNLVLMEYMACGKPSCASTGTGHADIHAATYPNSLRKRNDAAEWCECSPESVAREMERWIKDTPEARSEAGEHARTAMQQFTWSRAARQIVDAIEGLQ